MCRTLGTMFLAATLFLAAYGPVQAQKALQAAKMARQIAIQEELRASQGKAPSEPQADGGDEDLLRSVGIPTDGPGLLNYFRLRSRGVAAPERVAELIEQLGDKSPIVAQKASGELASLGAPAVPLLRQAVKDPDRQQIARLAQRCLQAVEQHPGQVSSAAARLIGVRRPPGAAEALLMFLPQAEDEGVVEEIRLTLAAVAYAGGKPDPALLKAVQDSSPIRRALAIDTLCHNGLSLSILEQLPLRELMHDLNPLVRLRASLVLARARDAKAVSTLITLLSELPLDQARQAEEFLTELAGEQAPKTALSGDSAGRQKCRDAWATWWQASEDSNHLLDELRKRTVTEALRQKCEGLIQQLGDADFAVREKAQAEVKAMGSMILPLLRQATHDKDLEIRNRARDCLNEMERDKSVPLSPITPRLIALRKPAGAAESLLAFAPYADEEATLPEVQLALNVVAFKDGKPELAVVRALSDPQATRRAAAAEALCLGGDRAHLPAIRKMLADSEPAVRLKAALALAGTGQRDAVPVLIELLNELPTAQAEPAEEYLQRLAGEQAPNLPSGDDNTARKKRRDVWAAWWKANSERVALVDRYPPAGIERYLGYILLVIANTGEVLELDRDRKVRWHLNGLMNPRDVQVLGNDRILIAEWNAQRVSERNRRGDIIWQKQTQGTYPLAAQRLPNGHTFIACQSKLMEVDRAGNEVYSIGRPNDVIMARRMRDGQIILVSSNSQVIRMDTTGKQLKSFNVQMIWQTGVNILPNGHVIVPATWMNRVMEYDAEGKIVMQMNANQPSCADRLRNGNMLVAPQQWPSKVIETEPSGKQVSEFAVANFPYRIRTR
ncbi:MAG TPA: HEAT repeat domain-containing protein [Gemmataceae bacterium]|nr:HEAT repeat domain-containing protein [Gemmataceae bacterium]